MLNFKSEFLCHHILYSHLWQNPTSSKISTDISASSQYDLTSCLKTGPLKTCISSPKAWLESFLKQSRIPLKLETSAQPLSEAADLLTSTKIPQKGTYFTTLWCNYINPKMKSAVSINDQLDVHISIFWYNVNLAQNSCLLHIKMFLLGNKNTRSVASL